MVDITDKIDEIIRDYIECDEYFVINRARQYGKSTTLELLYSRLKKDYLVLDISFEAAAVSNRIFEMQLYSYFISEEYGRKIFLISKRKVKSTAF